MTAALLVAPPALRLHRSFESLGLQPGEWGAIAARGDTCTVFQDWHWVRCWWDCFGRGELAIAVAQEDGRVAAIAPLFVDSGMAYLVGSGGSDYLDFIGDVCVPGRMEALLSAVLDAHPGLQGIVLYLVPDASLTGPLLRQAASRLGLECCDEGAMPAPVMTMDSQAQALRATDRPSLLRNERKLRRSGELRVLRLRTAAAILPWLDDFFDQHERRWQGSGSPSLFQDPAQRAFYRAIAARADDAGWLRFMVLLSDGRPLAFHFGMAYGDSFLWYKPAFEIDRSRDSPGEVLLRQLILAAREEGATRFDFGLGDEAFKRRFADRAPLVRTWGLYRAGSGAR